MQPRGTHDLSFFTLLVLFGLIGVPCSLVFAQAGKAEVTGEVRDQNGAAITQSRVVATDVATEQTLASSSIFEPVRFS